MDSFAAALMMFLQTPVENSTGLREFYDLKLEWSTSATLITSIQEQLGLQLEPRKGWIDVLVVDAIEKPSAN